MKHGFTDSERVTTALLLAAGTGSRLQPLTESAPKCLTMVNGVSILERLIASLQLHGFERLIVVTGFMENHIREFLRDRAGDIEIEYVFSPLYKTTNNIYSLWMARHLLDETFLLLESDLVFDESLLEDMLYPDRMAIASMQPWMNGTCVTINENQRVESFLSGSASVPGQTKFKTVNIYCISLNSWRCVAGQLDRRIAEGRLNDYYEVVFADMVAAGDMSFEAVSFDHKPWYEIDTIEDLENAEQQFLATGTEVREISPLSRPNLRRHEVATYLQRTAEVMNATT